MSSKKEPGNPFENRSIDRLELRCGQLEEHVTKLINSLADRRAAVVRLKDSLESQMTLDKRTAQAVEGDNGKLEQTYYDLCFERLAEAQLFNMRIEAIRSALSETPSSGCDKVFALLDYWYVLKLPGAL